MLPFCQINVKSWVTEKSSGVISYKVWLFSSSSTADRYKKVIPIPAAAIAFKAGIFPISEIPAKSWIERLREVRHFSRISLVPDPVSRIRSFPQEDLSAGQDVSHFAAAFLRPQCRAPSRRSGSHTGSYRNILPQWQNRSPHRRSVREARGC